MDPVASSPPSDDSKVTTRADASEIYSSDTKHLPTVATIEQPQQHAFVDPASYRPRADSFSARRSHLASLIAWRQEILTLLIGASALAAIIGTLAWFSRKEQPTWKHSINLNTLIAILSTVLRVCVLYGVEEALSQMKWLWFRRPRSLRHLEYFDAAARGPGGSLFLPFRLRRLDSVFIGCLVVIFSVGIGPFTQQAIKAVPCNVASGAMSSSIQVANTNSYFDFPRIASGAFDLGLDTKAAILQALANPTSDRSAITADCPTGNCTFKTYNGITHSSMAMCKKCVDITRWLYEARPNEGGNTTVYGSDKMDGSVEYNLFLPADKPLADDMPFLWTSVGGAVVQNDTLPSHMAYAPNKFLNATTLEGWDWLLARGNLYDSFRAAVKASVLNFSMITLTTDGCSWQPFQDPEYPDLSRYNTTCSHPSLNASSYWNIVNVVATACAFYPCVKDFHGDVVDTVYTETVVRETPANRSPDDVEVSIAPQAVFNDHCIINQQPVTLENVSSIASADRTLNSTYVDGRNVSVPHECFYEFSGAYIRGVQNYLSKTLTGSCEMPGTQSFTIGADPRTWRAVDCGEDTWWLRSLYNNGNATFKTIDANMEAIAVAMSNELRRTGSAWDGTASFVQGNVSRATVCTHFDWKWLSFPLALLVLTTLMLVIVSVKTLFDKQQTPIWKSSALPLLFTGNGIGMMGAQDKVDREADGTVVSLKKREDGGWEFVNQGFQSEGATTSGHDGFTASSSKARAVVQPVS
ncbi:hypothetical protein E8E12_006950 [Didymella heteroderae]|uniref:Uncharacterized protein n=1 Tax=Didymella heteroderae TaxID=1769908 RepID=A0A9P4WLA2_9PLEO|nr:hypothetical protein E8E12_006950 [Didymella heteroderae]